MINIFTGFLIAVILLLAYWGLIWAVKEFRKISEAKKFIKGINNINEVSYGDSREMRELRRKDMSIIAGDFNISKNELIKRKIAAEKIQMTAETLYYLALTKKDLELKEADRWLETINMKVKELDIKPRRI